MKFEFRFPDIGEGLDEGVIMKWMVEEGDMVKEGDSLAEVETDKVTTEIPSPRTGRVGELKFKEGDTITVGQVFVTIETEAEAGLAPTEPEPEPQAIEEEETAGVVGEVVASSEVIPPSTEEVISTERPAMRRKVLATPVARKMAKDLGIDINTLVGTGPNGRVMKEDILRAKEQEAAKVEEVKAPSAEAKAPVQPALSTPSPIATHGLEERVPLTRIRKTISERMSQSRFTIPHTTAMDEIDVTKLDEFRRKYKDLLLEEEVKLTYLPFIVKAAIVALKRIPEFNSSLDETSEEIVLKYFYNIGIATDTDRGLLVPVIKDADKLSIVELARAIEEVSTRAKEGKTELHELREGTFSITNYGSIGGHFGIPIINYPESAVLGLGRVVEKPIVRDGEIVIAKILPVSLSYDHRIIDGASGARFINILKDLLSNPDILLLRA
ncbi:MAG: dihydrolipoamide acetyltransferase family protein [Tissierellaceae bacterium]|jgi:pyruvate dehydrogenase E2 component (dihydrolipoamide acetyltransferase)|nr:2-oxo acid dehydrogenase subunit E2 [Tissierellia bacterium]